MKLKAVSAMRQMGSYLNKLFKQDHEEVKEPVVEFDENKLDEVRDLVANEFNVLLYGIGSKFALMKTLSTEYLSEVGDVIFVNGAAAVNPKQILGKLIQHVSKKCGMRQKTVPSRQTDQITWLEDRLSKLSKSESFTRIILVLHCFDVIIGVDTTNCETFKRIAEMKRIQIVASIENSRCFTIWDSITLSSLHFVYINQDTYLPYQKEECYFLDQYTRHEEVKERGLVFILKSLTDRHRYARCCYSNK